MIELLPFDINHAPKLISKIKDEKMLLQFAGPAYHFPLTKEQLAQDLSNENRTLFRVVETASHTTIGHAQILLKEKIFLLGRILIWDENNRGKGYGKKLVLQLVEYGLRHFDKDTAELNVYDWNTGAIECYKKVGFEIDPTVTSEVYVEGEKWLSINMKMNVKNYKIPMS
ncbi:GNAT family N-acetyltransferase [Chryseobacterium soli]|uniref:GNAT family N-acetyltransferase n=1 Tax=Chryseobacterium soli TaxID=445961 RepID=UPI002954741B|nr:GNAT family protein [Chryseobacterium soli]MDV7699540.1 GNAT family N-acetyltransferase [Chryseobacterium soli]